jgi:hypothetical protein
MFCFLQSWLAEYRSTLKKIEKTRSIAKIYDLLQPDTFEPY